MLTFRLFETTSVLIITTMYVAVATVSVAVKFLKLFKRCWPATTFLRTEIAVSGMVILGLATGCDKQDPSPAPTQQTAKAESDPSPTNDATVLEAYRKIADETKSRYSKPPSTPPERMIVDVNVIPNSLSVQKTNDMAAPYSGKIRGLVTVQMDAIPGQSMQYEVIWPHIFRDGHWIDDKIVVTPNSDFARANDFSATIKLVLATW